MLRISESQWLRGRNFVWAPLVTNPVCSAYRRIEHFHIVRHPYLVSVTLLYARDIVHHLFIISHVHIEELSLQSNSIRGGLLLSERRFNTKSPTLRLTSFLLTSPIFWYLEPPFLYIRCPFLVLNHQKMIQLNWFVSVHDFCRTLVRVVRI